jgi:tetratricopeptide (TPR) repeat protein
MKIVLLTVVLALAMGCASPAQLPAITPVPTATLVPAITPVPFLARQLDITIDPEEAATVLLNPSPLGKGGYPKGMVVTIDILPKEGWQVDGWAGPVLNIDGSTAQIQMDSSRSVAVRLKSTTPISTPPDTPKPPTAELEEADEGESEGEETEEAEQHYNKGVELREEGLHDQAIEEYDRAIELDSDYADAYVGRGDAYYYLGEYQPAIEDYDQAIELDPDFADAYVGRGDAYYYLGEYQPAIEDYDQAIELDPDYADAYDSRGWAHYYLGLETEAEADFVKACSLDSQYC